MNSVFENYLNQMVGCSIQLLLFEMSSDNKEANKDFLFRFGLIGRKQTVDQAQTLLNKLESGQKDKLEKCNMKLISWTKEQLKYHKFFDDTFLRDNQESERPKSIDQFMEDVKSEWKLFKLLKQDTIKCLDQIPDLNGTKNWLSKVKYAVDVAMFVEKIMNHLKNPEISFVYYYQQIKDHLSSSAKKLASQILSKNNSSCFPIVKSEESAIEKYQTTMIEEIQKLKVALARLEREKNIEHENWICSQQKVKQLSWKVQHYEGFKKLYELNMSEFDQKTQSLMSENNQMKQKMETLNLEMSGLKQSMKSIQTRENTDPSLMSVRQTSLLKTSIILDSNENNQWQKIQSERGSEDD